VINHRFVEVGRGYYLFTTNYPTNFRGGIKFYCTDSLVGLYGINPEDFEYTDARISSRATGIGLSSNIITSLSSIEVNGDVQLRLSDDYYATEGRSIDITSDSWPSLVGASMTFEVAGQNNFIKVMTLVNATTLRVELTNQELAYIGAGRWSYEVRAVLSNGHIVTLAVGNMIIVPSFAD
jgi:hypothetical protein